MIKEKDLIVTAKGISSVFSPFYVPLVTFTSLFLFSYLRELDDDNLSGAAAPGASYKKTAARRRPKV